MFPRFAALLALVMACGPVPARAQSTVTVESDLRVFTIVAALNVAGFDSEIGSQYHPAREAVRRIGDKLDPDLKARLREFYARHKGSASDDEQLSKYISLASVLTAPPEFKPVTREEGLPGPAREVLGFVELLREFYQKAGILQRWAELRDLYDEEMDRVALPVRESILRTDSYLRVPLGGPSSHTMRITVELAASINSVNVRSHQNDYLVVLGYSSDVKIDEIRHAYLHLRLNDTAAIQAVKVARRDSLPQLLVGQTGVQREYAVDFYTMMTESLIRAVEIRADRLPAAQAQELLQGYYRSGLLLIPYFHDELQKYEQADGTLTEALASMAASIDVGREVERFKQTFHTLPVPRETVVRAEIPAPVKADPAAELLKVAQAAFEKDKPKAREAFERVLKEHDPNNGRALYGLGLIALDEIARDETRMKDAQRYFELAIKSSTADQSMKTWSHIHLGRILDFTCDRQAALENYRRAIAIGDNSQNAQRRAEEGLSKPYAGGCQQ